MNWRQQAAPIIARVIAEVGRDDEKKLRSALREAYPFGERAMHPYKIWCDEVRRQIGEPSPTMSVAEARELLILVGEFWQIPLRQLEIGWENGERLRKLAEEMDKCAPLLNADSVMIAEKDAKFLRRLAAKVKSKAAAPAGV